MTTYDLTTATPFEVVGILHLFFQPKDPRADAGMSVHSVPVMYRVHNFTAVQPCDGLYGLLDDLATVGADETAVVDHFEQCLAAKHERIGRRIEYGRVDVFETEHGNVFFWISEPAE